MKDKKFVSTELKTDDKLSIGLGIISFIIPVVGIVIYFINKNVKPKKAVSAIYLSIAGFAIVFLLNFFHNLK